MLYHLTLAKNYVREPDKFIKTAVNMLRTFSTDTFIVSWPKAGRTWLRVMLGRAIILHCDLDERSMLDTYALTKRVGCDRVLLTHAGPFHLPDTRALSRMSFHAWPYGYRKVLMMIRDIRDVLVSYYFQESKRTRVFRGDIGTFIRNDTLGVRKVVAYYSLWYRNRHRPKAFMLMRYEDMHANCARQVRRALDFIGLENISDETVHAAVEFGSFSNMRKVEASGAFHDSMLQARATSDSETFKVRRGKIGGYVDYLSESDVLFIRQAVQELGEPGCDWYFAPSLSSERPACPVVHPSAE